MQTLSQDLRQRYQAVIGIECHVELKTASKMFCGCPNIFGGEPNTRICPVCTALPGALPVPNRVAIRHLVLAALAVGGSVARYSKFDRKSYFYPDMPKNYQISQFDTPLCDGGVVEYWLADGERRRCRLNRIHLEEDTGKLLHLGSGDGRLAGSAASAVDFNRAGVPLMECVSEPEIHSAEEAVGYLEALKRLFQRLGISDVKMEEGSLRCDANVSIRPHGSLELGTKTEIKNMNSFRSVYRAIESEIVRQIELVERGERIVQETRGWNESSGVTHSMRSKEQAHDYRYFPDPDLVPILLEEQEIALLQASLPEMPWVLFDRFVGTDEMSPAIATQLIDTPGFASYVTEVHRHGVSVQSAANFVLGDLARLSNETGIPLADAPLTPAALAELIGLVEAQRITSKVAKELILRLWRDGGLPTAIVEREGLAQVADPAALAEFVDAALAAHPQSVSDWRAGKENALKFLLGQVMKASRGRANPVLAEQLLHERLVQKS